MTQSGQTSRVAAEEAATEGVIVVVVVVIIIIVVFVFIVTPFVSVDVATVAGVEPIGTGTSL
jgi:uncharacterized integral membrane protein